MPSLPDIAAPAAFYELLRRPGQWADAIEAIKQEHGLFGTFTQSTNGSTVVFLSEHHCIKLHPPLPGFLASHEREVAALRCIGGGLAIPIPELLAGGALGPWRYFVATRLPGRPIDAVWDDLDRPTRADLATQLGHAIAELHAVDAAALAAVTEPWADFRPSQRARGMDPARRKGLTPERIAEVDDYLQRLDAIPEALGGSSVLHTEIGPSHVLVDEGRITGLIDFGDATVGDPEYDIAPVGLFVTRGDAAAFRAFCVAYGLDDEALADPARPARLMRHALLHRYGTLAWYLDVLAPPKGSLQQLAAYWFGVG